MAGAADRQDDPRPVAEGRSVRRRTARAGRRLVRGGADRRARHRGRREVRPREQERSRTWRRRRGVSGSTTTPAGLGRHLAMEIVGDTPTLTRSPTCSARPHEELDPDRPAEEQPSLEHRKVAALARSPRRRATSTTAYVHLTLADLTNLPDGAGEARLGGEVRAADGRHDQGAARPAASLTVHPCSTSAVRDAVDQHDPPEWMRELVILRDRRACSPTATGRSRLRPRPHRGLRRDGRRWTARPDPAGQPRAAVPATPPGEDPLRLDLRPQPGRQLHLDRPARPPMHVDARGVVTRH